MAPPVAAASALASLPSAFVARVPALASSQVGTMTKPALQGLEKLGEGANAGTASINPWLALAIGLAVPVAAVFGKRAWDYLKKRATEKRAAGPAVLKSSGEARLPD